MRNTDYLSIKKIAKKLDVSQSTVYNLIYRKRIPYSKIDRRYIIKWVDVEAYIQKNTIEALP